MQVAERTWNIRLNLCDLCACRIYLRQAYFVCVSFVKSLAFCLFSGIIMYCKNWVAISQDIYYNNVT